MKKHKFPLSNLQDYSALALVSPEKDYKFCFLLNKALHIKLDKAAFVHDEKAQAPGESESNDKNGFPAYIYHDDYQDIDFYIIKNKNENKYLLPQMKQADYLFLLKGKDIQQHIENIKRIFTSLPYIHSTFAIPNNYLTHLKFD